MKEITVDELAALRERAEPHVLLDVREPDELAAASVPEVLAIPMAEIPARTAELPRDVPLVVMCHHGGRSARVTRFLEAQGFTNAANLDGGIEAWSLRIDPTVPRY